MINFTEGNLLEADADALVNTVNTVGIMGKGVALMFKEAFPRTSGLMKGRARKNAYGWARCLSPNAKTF